MLAYISRNYKTNSAETLSLIHASLKAAQNEPKLIHIKNIYKNKNQPWTQSLKTYCNKFAFLVS